MSLKKSFAIKNREVISLVGAGGKTSLMFALAKELSAQKACVVTSTTTKIYPPTAIDTPLVIHTEQLQEIKKNIEENKFCHLTVVAKELVDVGKLAGVTPKTIDKIFSLPQVDYVIVEADGARRLSLKAHKIPKEPVIPQSTTLVIPIVGIDILGKPLLEENVLRAKIASQLLQVPLGTKISAVEITKLLLHPQGFLATSPPLARVIPFINKVEPQKEEESYHLAQCILSQKHPKISTVVMGEVQNLTFAVVKIDFKKNL